MLAWAKRRARALAVATLMFAVMATVMAEFLTRGDFTDVFSGESVSARGMLWTWRVGGLLTWPVFMWLLLRPYANGHSAAHRTVLARTLAVAAVYGGGGLWAISAFWQAFLRADESILIALSPFMALVAAVLPYAYTWGFVALYGFARDALAGGCNHGWVSRSLWASVLGVYGIGALVYAALGVVTVPIVSVVSLMPEEVSLRLAVDIWAIAISTGNFASQWYSFYKVDEWLDGAERGPAEPQDGRPPAAPAPDGNVYLADGRIVTPDGRVYVPQDTAGGTAAVPPQPVSSGGAARAGDAGASAPTPPWGTADDPYGFKSKG